MKKKKVKAAVRDYRLPFLFAVSFLSLFLELLLIRWIGTEIRIFAYFRNLTLISCFLGLGIGFSLKRFRLGLLSALWVIAGVVAAAHPKAVIHGVSLRYIPNYLAFPEYNIWYAPVKASLLKMIAGYSMLAAVVVALAAIMIPFGQILGDLFSSSSNRLRDYSINLAGSLAGTWVFFLFSYLNTPPQAWFLLAAGAMAALVRPWPKRTAIAIAAWIAIVFLSTVKDPPNIRTYWSPYQKLELSSFSMDAGGIKIPAFQVFINSASYMVILNLSDTMYQLYPTVFIKDKAPYYPYNLPYQFHPRPKRVLIVGAGGGNDTAAALRNGAEEIDAVEIDPVIARLGRTYNVEKPYNNPRVNLIIDDARSYFKKTTKRYDMIVFALLDSHTLLSNFTNINLDSYVYTRESIEEAKAHLAEGGIISLSFFVQTNYVWLGWKVYRLVTDVFGQPPLAINNYGPEMVHGTGGFLLLCGDREGINRQIADNPALADHVRKFRVSEEKIQESQKENLPVPSDDWPYLYLKHRQIPNLYYILFAVLILLLIPAIPPLIPNQPLGLSHFLFLGAGFMLVEVHSISKAALLFGSTWITNVVIISAILVMVLLANLLTLRYRFERMHWWYLGILASLFLSYEVPVDRFLVGSYWTRGIIVGAFYSLPLFFAGVVFASSIRKVQGMETAFAANMLGSALGGMLEVASFLYGLKSVVLIALVLYIASALTLNRIPLLQKKRK